MDKYDVLSKYFGYSSFRKPYLRGGVECDIRTVDIDEMIIFKLAEKSNDLQIEEFNKMEIHDLDYLLDMVRAKYYNSPNLRRPTISWTNDYPTDYYGCYTYYNNHIVISRVLNDKRVTTEMISMVIYHESLHQDFAEHNDDFNKKISLFPNYEKLDKKLRDFIDNVHEELQYPSNFNSFTRGKKRIIYISLPYADNYPKANQQDNTNIFCVCEIIKLFVVLHRTDEAVPFYRKYEDKLPHTDEQLNRCLKLLE